MRATTRITLLLLLFLAPAATLVADELVIDLGELDAALAQARNGGDPLQQLLADNVATALSEAGLRLEQGRLLVSDRVEDEVLESGCSDTTLREMDIDVAINAGSAFSFAVNSLSEPIVLASAIDASVAADGEVRQRYGVVVLGNCSRVAQDTFTFEVDGPLRLSLALALELNPVLLPDGISITPRFTVSGELISYDLDVDVDDTIVAGLLEDYIEDEIEAQLSGAQLQALLQDFEDDLHQAVIDAWGADHRVFLLPDVGDLQIAGLLHIISQQTAFPVLLDYVAANRLQILLALLSGDDALLNEILLSASACDASAALLADLASEPLYIRDGAACAQADLSAAVENDFYSDASCTAAVAYRATPYADFCAQALDPEQLGNAADIDATPPHWTLTAGTRFDISILPLAPNHQPFMQRARYKEIGDCHLEMRIYKRSLEATGLRPLLAVHGGSWRYRAATFYTLEAQISHLTERGFVVFAPFYRLVDTADGNPECNDARGEDLIEDITDALDWVIANAGDYGAAAQTVTVMGQSAGAHLVGWLATHRSAQVERALMLYAPADLGDFLAQYRDGAYANGTGIASLESFLGMALDAVDLASAVVADNSFPDLVAADPAAFPRTFLLHGGADDLVPARQSERLCNAFAGTPERGALPAGGATTGGAREVFTCGGNDSHLHLLTEAGHGLDVCIAGLVCPAGGVDGRAAAAASLADALNWLIDAPPDTPQSPAPSAAGDAAAGGGSSMDLLVLALLLSAVLLAYGAGPCRARSH